MATNRSRAWQFCKQAAALSVVFGLLAVSGSAAAEPAATVTPGFRGTVVHVLDAGLLVVRPAEANAVVQIKLIGLAAPHKASRELEGQEPWGTRAQQWLALKIARTEVRVEFDVVPKTEDGKSRWGYVWLGDELVNELVLREGHAVLDTRPPNVRHVERLVAAQRLAREQQRNVWNPADPLPEPPARFAVVRQQAKEAQKTAESAVALGEFVEGCVIGNRQTRTYHLPGGRYYKTARTSKNAIFFRTEADAKNAGYNAASR